MPCVVPVSLSAWLSPAVLLPPADVQLMLPAPPVKNLSMSWLGGAAVAVAVMATAEIMSPAATSASFLILRFVSESPSSRDELRLKLSFGRGSIWRALHSPYLGCATIERSMSFLHLAR